MELRKSVKHKISEQKNVSEDTNVNVEGNPSHEMTFRTYTV